MAGGKRGGSDTFMHEKGGGSISSFVPFMCTLCKLNHLLLSINKHQKILCSLLMPDNFTRYKTR